MATATATTTTTTRQERAIVNRNMYWGIAIAALVVLAIVYALSARNSMTRETTESTTTTTTSEMNTDASAVGSDSTMYDNAVTPDSGSTGTETEAAPANP